MNSPYPAPTASSIETLTGKLNKEEKKLVEENLKKHVPIGKILNDIQIGRTKPLPNQKFTKK